MELINTSNDFDEVESYNAADETINFGTRCLAEGDNLYEAVTLAVLKNSNENPCKFPEIKSYLINDLLYIAIGRTFRIFEDPKALTLRFNAKLDETIDAFCVAGNYVLICLRNGDVLLLDVVKLEVIMNKSIILNLCLQEKYFVGVFDCRQVEGVSFLILNKNGCIYKLECNYQSDTCQVETLFDLKQPSTGGLFSAPILFVNGAKLAVCNIDDVEYISNNTSIELKQIYSYMPHKVIGLSSDGNLIQICLLTLLIVPLQTDYTFTDFLLLQENDETNCIVTAEIDGQLQVQLLTCPECNQIFSLKLSGEIHLVNMYGVSNEPLYISKIENELRIQMVLESSPEKRFEKLLRKKNLEEAEKFARQWGLDVEIVTKAKARRFVEKSNCESEEIDSLIEILISIKDVAFKLHCCLNVSCDSFEDVQKILNYGASINLQTQASSDDVNYYFSSINNMKFRFDTYSILCDNKLTYFDSSAWCDFSTCNLFEYLLTQLKLGDIEASFIVYSRLDNETLANLTETDVETVFQTLKRLQPTACLPFMYTFIPKTLSHVTGALPLFVRWIRDSVFLIEANDFSNFPENALGFIDKCNSQLTKIDTINVEPRLANTSGLTELAGLVEALKTIRTLKNNYMVQLPLQDALKGPESLIRAILNIEICDMEIFLKRFLIKFMIEHNCDPDEIFFNEIEELISYKEYEEHWSRIVPFLWSSICSTKLRCQALLSILQQASLPWSDVIHSMLKQALELKHPDVKLIEIEIENEPIYVVLDKRVYNLMTRKLDVDDKYIIRRIIYCDEPTMVEDVQIVVTTNALKKLANALLIENFVNKNEVSRALDLMRSHTPDQIASYINTIIYQTQAAVESYFYDEIVVKNYFSVLKSALGHLSNEKKLITDVSNFEEIVANLQAIVHLKSLNFKYKLAHLETEERRKTVLYEVLEASIGNETSTIWEIASSVSIALRLEKDAALIKLCDWLPDFNFHSSVAELVHLNTDPKLLIEMSTTILRHIGVNKVNLTDSLSIGETTLLETSYNLDVIKTCLRWARKLISKAILAGDLTAWEIFDFTFEMVSDSGARRHLFNGIYTENMTTFSISSVDAIRDVFNIYESKPNVNLSRMPLILQNLSSEGNHLTGYSLLVALQNRLDPQTAFTFSGHLQQCNQLLVQKLFACSTIDENLALYALMLYPIDKAVQIIKKMMFHYKQNMKKFKVIAILGIKLCRRHNQIYPFFKEVALLIKWFEAIDGCTVGTKDFFKSKKSELLEKLILGHHLNVKQVQEFCEDFELKKEDGYYIFLKKLLVNWKPNYKVELDLKGKPRLIMKDDNMLYSNCLEVIELIGDKDGVTKFIDGLKGTINMYHYEVFMCVVSLLAMLKNTNAGQKNYVLLQILKNYTRVSKPSTTETEEWYTLFPDTQMIDPLSEWRLPFTSTLFSKDIWNILRPEINLKNYAKWFETLPILNQYLNKNDICTYVVKEAVVTAGFLEDKTEYILHPKYSNLLNEIDVCIQHITDLERSTSVAYYLTNHIPPGADRVNAIKLCYKYAKLYREAPHETDEDEDIQKAFIKVHNKYFSFSTMHILHTYDLAENKYLQLFSQPNELIEALYSDERIIKKGRSVILHCPDINRAVDAISELYGIDVGQKRQELLDNWLNCNDVNVSLDESNIGLIKPIEDDREESCFYKSAYLCTSGDVSHWRDYLYKRGLIQDERYGIQARALKCLCAISSAEEVDELTNCPYKELLDFIDKLILLHNLDRLGITVDMEALNECNKKDLLKRLSRNATHPLNLKVMAAICVCFNIEDLKYFEFIVTNMIRLKMNDDLKTCIHFLKNHCTLYNKFYVDAWQSIIDGAFSTLTQNEENESDVDRLCIENMLSLQSCPVLHQLELQYVFYAYLKLKRVDLAALLLQYFHKNKRSDLCKDILAEYQASHVAKLVSGLYEHGLSGSKKVVDILADL